MPTGGEKLAQEAAVHKATQQENGVEVRGEKMPEKCPAREVTL